MKFQLFCIALCLGLVATTQAQRNKIEFEKYTLDNGLKVILHQDNSTPIVAVAVTYHVGSKNEKTDRTGFAHFFEHLLFEGSENIERGQMDKLVTNAGGQFNAYTTQDKTYYFENMPSNQLALGLWIESERMMHAKVENKGIETQREVVKEERRLRIENAPYQMALPSIMERAFKQHPYRWPVIGSMEHLNAATEEDYKHFYKTYYVPNNAILSIAGDIDIAETKELVAKYFGPIPRGKGEISRPNIVEPPIASEIRDTVYDKNIQLPAVIQGYRMPAQGTEDYYALQMLSQLLSQGQSSRFYKALVDEQQKAIAAGNLPLPLEDPGIAIAFGITNMGVSLPDLEAAMDAEVQKVQNELITEREFQKLKNQIENNFVSRNSTMGGIADNIANYEMYFGDANLINTEIERYLKVTREDIRRVAKKYLSKSNRVTLYYMPKPVEP